MTEFVRLQVRMLANTETTLSDEQVSELIGALCQKKAADFMVLGYHGVDAEDIWHCLEHKYVRLPGWPALHVLVDELLSLQVTEFMNWRTLSLYK